MDMGTKDGILSVMPSSEKSKSKKHYPTVTIEKKTGNYKPGDTFTAQVKFRVKSITMGKEYDNDPKSHRCTLEILSMDKSKSSKHGLPGAGY